MKRNRNPTNKPVMKRYATLDSPIVLLSFSYHPPIVLLSSSYRSPIILLSFSYWETENNTETIRNGAKDERRTSERRTKDERMRIGGTRVINLTIIYL